MHLLLIPRGGKDFLEKIMIPTGKCKWDANKYGSWIMKGMLHQLARNTAPINTRRCTIGKSIILVTRNSGY